MENDARRVRLPIFRLVTDRFRIAEFYRRGREQPEIRQLSSFLIAKNQAIVIILIRLNNTKSKFFGLSDSKRPDF